MKKRFRLMLVIVFLTACGFSLLDRSDAVAASSLPQQDQEKTTEQTYRNIQVLKGLPASQLQAIMALMTGSLGVRCNYCHVNPFDKDEKAAKQTARMMMQMVFDLNKGRFAGRDAITCYTCHRGQTKPAAVVALEQNLWQNPAGAKPEAALPSVDQVLDRYEQAIGGKAALMKVTNRILKGSRVGADGVLVPEEVYQQAPNKLLVMTSYPDIVFRSGFNGTNGWARSSKGDTQIGSEQLAELVRDAQSYGNTRIRELYSQMAVEGRTTLGDREALIINATTHSGLSEKLFFDAQTGLLLRRYRESRTALGPFPTQTDYEDYKEVDGVKLPFGIRWSMPGRSWGRKIAEVKQNTVIDDAIFNPPDGKN
ncbi:MAG: photosynthetic reaction center cytochrome c subunit [Blastocatellia bacterium]